MIFKAARIILVPGIHRFLCPIFMRTRFLPYLSALTAIPALFSAAALADDVDILPAKSTEVAGIPIEEDAITDPDIKLTPDKSELLRLDTEVSTVIVGNPAHLSILPENGKTLVLVPKAPGATFFIALDKDKNIIMQRHVIVDSPKEKYVRIRKSCVGSKQTNCQETQVYYCPDMCHEIIINPEQEKSASLGAGAAAGAEDAANPLDTGQAAPIGPAPSDKTE